MTELELFDKLNPKRDLPQATCDVISQVYKVMQKDNAEKDKQIEELKEIIDNDVDKKIYVQLAKKAELADVQKGQLTKKDKEIAELKKENELIKNSDSLCRLIGEQKRKIIELEQQIEKMKSDVRVNIKVADQSNNCLMYQKLNSMLNQWEGKRR